VQVRSLLAHEYELANRTLSINWRLFNYALLNPSRYTVVGPRCIALPCHGLSVMASLTPAREKYSAFLEHITPSKMDHFY